jgi:hypothetical protein
MRVVARSARAIPLCAAASLAWAAAAGVAVAQSPSPGPAPRTTADQIVLSGRAVVARGQSAGEIVVLHGRAIVAGVATADVLVVDGPVFVTGQVAGDVVALGGDVTLTGSAQVGGDVLAGGEVRAASGAQVRGEVRRHVRFTLQGRLGAAGRFVSWIAVSVSTLLLGLFLLWLVPVGTERVVSASRTAPWASLLWGVAVTVLVPVVCVALLASVVGLPVGLAALLALALISLLGYAVAAIVLGRRVVHAGSRLLSFLVGLAILRAVGLIPVASGVTFGLAAIAGVGAAVVAVWRARGRSDAGKHRPGRAAPVSGPAQVVDVVEEETSTGLA